MANTIQLIVGLANPGAEYDQTRHNAGAWFVEQLAAADNVSLQPDSKFQGLVGNVMVGNKLCRLLIPTTYMNHSGRAVAAIASYYKIPADGILIAHDELDLPPGVARLKVDGGHGGHNGLRDTIKALNTNAFVRARIGIGHPGDASKVTNYVLGRPSISEHDRIHQSIAELIAVLPKAVNGELNAAMKQLHTES